MKIDIARPADYPMLGDLAVAAYRAVPGMDSYEEHIDELRDFETRARHNTIFAARIDGELAGVVIYVPGADSPLAEFDDPRAGGVRALAVGPTFQGRGVGRALTERCMAQARRDGHERVVLHTTAELVGARRLYDSMGFARTTELDFTADDGTLLMGYMYSLA